MWIASHPFRDEAIDAALVVPSTSGTEARHPLEAVIDDVDAFPWPRLQLVATGERVERRRLNPSAFTAPAEVAGKTVLLFDDVYASGATAQSAAKAIISAGGRVHRIVPLARRMNPDHDLATAIAFTRQRALGAPPWATHRLRRPA
jgi:hypothetical protein